MPQSNLKSRYPSEKRGERFWGRLALNLRIRRVSDDVYRGRWEHGQGVRREAKVLKTTPLGVLRQRIYVDTLTHSASALRFLIGELGPGRVLLGSDYPADMGTMARWRRSSSLV